MKKLTLYIFILLCPFWLRAQNVSINQGGALPDNSAMLDVSSTNSGLLLPRMTLVQRNALISPANSLLIYQTDNTPGYYFNSGTTVIPVWDQLITSGDNLGNHIATTNIQLNGNYLSGDGGNEGIFVDNSGNIGIGTNSPSRQLQIHESVATSSLAQYTTAFSGQTASDGFVMGYADGIGAALFNGENSNLAFGTNNAYRMWLSPSGDLGVGTSAPVDKLEVFNAGNVRVRTRTTTNGFSGLVAQNSLGEYFVGIQGGVDPFPGEFHIYQNSPLSGQRMVIDNGGNMGVGISNPTARLHISSATSVTSIIESSSTIGTWLALRNSSVGGQYHQIISTGSGNGEGPGKMLFGYGASANTVSGIAMTIQDRDVGIGTTTPTTRLTVDGGVDASLAGGGYIMTNVSTATNIIIDDNEIMARNNGFESPLYLQNDGGDLFVHDAQGATTQFTIQDNGSVGIGTNAPSSWLHLSFPSGVGNGFTIQNIIDADQWEFYLFSTNTLRLYFNGIQRGSFSDVNGAYTSTSDIRLKNSITDYSSVIDDVMTLNLKSYYFNWQDPSKSEKCVGFIAQDLLNVFPHLVHGGGKTTSEGEDYYSVDYSGFGPIAIKAIQEQQELIDKLNERIEKLEILLNELMSDE